MPKRRNTGKHSFRSGKHTSANLSIDQAGMLAVQYEQMLEELDAQLVKVQAQHRSELMELGFQEQEFFEHNCNLYSKDQLDMTLAELDQMIKAEKEATEKAKLEKQQHRKSRLAVRVPVGPPGRKLGKRKSSLVPGFVPIAGRVSLRRVPAAAKTAGHRNTGARPGRLGEITYSANGSPVRIAIGMTLTKEARGTKASGSRLHVLGDSFIV